jgi:hypothetical protein
MQILHKYFTTTKMNTTINSAVIVVTPVELLSSLRPCKYKKEKNEQQRKCALRTVRAKIMFISHKTWLFEKTLHIVQYKKNEHYHNTTMKLTRHILNPLQLLKVHFHILKRPSTEVPTHRHTEQHLQYANVFFAGGWARATEFPPEWLVHCLALTYFARNRGKIESLNGVLVR